MKTDAATVAVQRCPSYAPEELDRAVDALFDALSLDRLIQPDSRVLLKPNLVIKRRPEEATTTHPEVAAGVIRRLKKRGVTDIMIAESGGGPYTEALLKTLYAGTGFAEMAEREGVHLNLDTGETPLRCPAGARVKRFDVLAPYKDADLVINLPKLKSHCMMGLSGAVKNLFGLIPGLKKPELHYRFPDEGEFGEMLIDLCEAVRPAVSIVDAVMCMEGDGPSGGNPRFGGLLLAGEDPYTLDRVCAQVIGIDSGRITFLSNAVTRGLCPASLEDIEVLGEDVSALPIEGFLQPRSKSVNFSDRLPKPLRGLATAIATPRPVVQRAKCIGCRKCAESCPMNVITVNRRRARIHRENCIKCCCCHEMCPEKAIHIKRFTPFSL